MQNIIGVYKPKGPTSHDIIAHIRRITGIRRVGHAGTLDPLAEGVLVIGIGREATKQLGDVVKKEKEYIATVRFGITSTTDDEEGEKTEHAVSDPPSKDAIQNALKQFIGEIQQTPPIYSALKIKGTAAYKHARSGNAIVMQPRTVLIKEIELRAYEWPNAELRVVTGPGVYIRSLARDLGSTLGIGGYLAGLVRTRVGEFKIDDAIQPDKIGVVRA